MAVQALQRRQPGRFWRERVWVGNTDVEARHMLLLMLVDLVGSERSWFRSGRLSIPTHPSEFVPFTMPSRRLLRPRRPLMRPLRM